MSETTSLHKLGKYTLVEQLGHGGMAEVYKAFQPGVERMVALKVLYAHLARSADLVERFKREARAIGQLQHNHIVRVIDFDVENDLPYIVMEYIPHGSLRDHLSEQAILSIPEALAITGQLADALEYAHRQGMVHRDIKPGNVLFLDQRRTHAVLADFGIARLLNDVELTVSGSILGTPAYMAPEAMRGEPSDERADLYSLGVVLYEMVTGRTPYVGDTPYSVILKQANEPLPLPSVLNPELPPAVEALLLKALAKDRAERFQSAAEFRAALQQTIHALDAAQAHASALAAAGQPVGSTTSTPASPHRRLWRRLAGALGRAALVAAVGLALGGWGILSNNVNVVSRLAIGQTAPERAPLGRVQFVDNQSARAGDMIITVDLIGAPPPGYHYALWLVGDTAAAPRNLGSVPVQGNQIQFTIHSRENLLAYAHQAVIALEADAGGEVTPGPAVLSGVVQQELRTYTQQLLLDDTTNQRGLLTGLEEQAQIALDHAGLLRQTLAAGDLKEARRHAEHVVNILEGASGSHFGDLDGDGRAQNPGDGVGVQRYLAEALASARALQAGLPADSSERRYLLLAETSYTSDNALVARCVDRAQQVLAADSAAEAQPFAAELAVQLVALLQGGDSDGNGAIDPLAGEGGIAAAYTYVRLVNTISLAPAAGSLPGASTSLAKGKVDASIPIR